jgi:hypothetical protein
VTTGADRPDSIGNRLGPEREHDRWIILGWILTWAAVELNMLQRLLDTTSLSGREWTIVLALSLLAPAVVATDELIQLSRQRKARTVQGAELTSQGAGLNRSERRSVT